jgi:hypothetical protein
MTTGRDVPIALFLFNRPETLARVIDALRCVQPRRIFAFADGPRPDRPEDAERCRAARALVERLDWPCEVARDFAETNVGYNARITSGLDQVFQEATEAIVVEDDIVLHPSFFPWCARMLDRYRDDPAVMHVSGRNHLGRWTEAGDGHCLLRRGSAWGWATWRRAWQRKALVPDTADNIVRVVSGATIDPLVLDHLLMLQEMRAGNLRAWDTDWSMNKALLGGLSVVPSVNLAAHIGYGPGASNHTFAGDIGALTPVRAAPSGRDADRCVVEPRLDRWSVLFELMATYRAPALAWRLSRSESLFATGPLSADRRLRHHLAPFRNPGESLALIEHFCAAGAPAEPLTELVSVLRRAASDLGAPGGSPSWNDSALSDAGGR